MIKSIILTIITTILISTGQVLWKIGFQKLGGFYIKQYTIIENIFRIIKSGYVLSGCLVYIIATGIFMYLLSKYEISLIIPVMSISFIFALIAGILIFKEEVSIYQWFGVILIMSGVFLIIKNYNTV